MNDHITGLFQHEGMIFCLVSSDVFEKLQFQSDKMWGRTENSERLENNFLLCSSILLIQRHGN